MEKQTFKNFQMQPQKNSYFLTNVNPQDTQPFTILFAQYFLNKV